MEKDQTDHRSDEAGKQPVADLSQLTVSILLYKPTYGYDHYSHRRRDRLGVSPDTVCVDWIECVGFENFFPGSLTVHLSGWGGMSGGYTRYLTYHDIGTLQNAQICTSCKKAQGRKARARLRVEPVCARDVLSRAHATKNMVDDYLRGVGMPRNNHRVEQMLGIG